MSVSNCAMYDAPRRPMYDGPQATVICQCINPATEERTQIEITLYRREIPGETRLRDRLFRRDAPASTWRWAIRTEARNWQ